ncbi:MAG: LysE family translocator [Pseudomonadota bacterium]
MFGIHDLTLFIVSGLLLNIVPGPDTMLVVSRSATQGWRAGSAAALGIGAGTFVHVLAAALGMSALLATSAHAFSVVKWVGAAYLVYVGVRMWLAHAERAPAAGDATPPLPYRKIFAQGFLTNVLNPKVALFFLAFVPQFIDPASPTKALAFIALGCVFNLNSMIWSHGLALFSAAVGQRTRVGPRTACWLNRAIGAVFVAFGVRLAFGSRD